MSRSTEETRRDFLLRLAKAAVFVPPALATLDVDRAAAAVRQGKGGGGGKNSNSGKGKGGGTDGNEGTGAGNSIGSLSSSGQAVQNSTFQRQGQTSDREAPWSPGASTPAPWQRPPPTSSGGE